MPHLIRFLSAPLLLALTACPSRQPAQNQPAALAPLADFRHPGYAQYRGHIAGTADSLTLCLTVLPDQPGSSAVGSLAGTYYGPDGESHDVEQLSSQRLRPDSLLLVYYSPVTLDGTGGQQEIRWRLRRQPDGRLVGTVGGKAAELRPVRPELAFAVQSFADSVAAFPGRANSPYGHVGLQTLVPVGPNAVAQAVAANLRRQLRGDSLPDQPVPALPRLWQQQRADFVKMYRGEAAAMAEEPAPSPADSAEAEVYAASLRFTSQSNLSVVCQQVHFLSVRLLGSEYSGGVHGSYGSEVRSFDLRTGRWLSFDDLFRPEARRQLLPVLEQGVRRTLHLAEDEALEEQLLVKQIPLTTNVCLTPGGVLFVYPPYQIAAYALGEVQVFVPLAAVRSLLQPGLPLPGSDAGAAVRR